MTDSSINALSPASLPLDGEELVPLMQTGETRNAPTAAFGIPVVSPSAPAPLAQFQTWIDESSEPPMLRMYTGLNWAGLYTIASDGTLAVAEPLVLPGDPSSDDQAATKHYADTKASLAGATFTGAVNFPNGSAAAPSAAWNSSYGWFYDATNGGLGLSHNGVQVGYTSSTGFNINVTGGATTASLRVNGEAGTSISVNRFSSDASSPSIGILKSRGTIAAPGAVALNDLLGDIIFRGYNGTANYSASDIRAQVVETGTVSSSRMGSNLIFYTTPIGSATLTENMRLDQQAGLQLFGTGHTVIDTNRAVCPRATTISGAISPSGAGKLFYHSDAQGGVGELALDTGTAYRYPGQAAVKRITASSATYTPRADGRIVRDTATLSADGSLTLLTTNVTDGHKVELSRRGSSGGYNRNVFQADGTTLIAAVADNASAAFVYDGVAALWFQV